MTSTTRLFISVLLIVSSLELRIGRSWTDLCAALSEAREVGNQSRRRMERVSHFVVIAANAQRIAEHEMSEQRTTIEAFSESLSDFPS
jgi:hypothetical protein